MKCDECISDAEFRYLWPPDGSEKNSCTLHVSQAARLAMALGMKNLRVNRIVLEARDAVVRAALSYRIAVAYGGDERECLFSAVDRLLDEEWKSVEYVQRMMLEHQEKETTNHGG